MACVEARGCAEECRHPDDCAFGRLFSPHPRPGSAPFAAAERAPERLIVQALWGWPLDHPTVGARLVALCDAGPELDQLIVAMHGGLFAAQAAARGVTIAPVSRWTDLPSLTAEPTSTSRVLLTFATPVRSQR